MRSLIAAPVVTCAWVRLPNHACRYELRSGSDVYAIYEGLPASATCQTAEGSWTFQKSGMWRPCTQIRQQGTVDYVANLWWKTFRPTLELPGGLDFTFHYNLRNTAFVIKNWDAEDQLSFVSIKRSTRQRPDTCEATMECTARSGTVRELPLLALTGWYMLLLAT